MNLKLPSHYGYCKTVWDVAVLLATIYVAIVVPYNAAFHNNSDTSAGVGCNTDKDIPLGTNTTRSEVNKISGKMDILLFGLMRSPTKISIFTRKLDKRPNKDDHS